MDASEQQSFSWGRKFGAAFHVAIATASMLAVVVMVNYLAARHFIRRDYSSEKKITLSPLTERVLGGITNEIKATVYLEQHDPLHDAVVALLREYTWRNPRVKLSVVHPTESPGEAQVVRKAFGLTGPNEKDFVGFEGNGRRRIVHRQELFDFELEPDLAASTGEENAFRKAMRAFKGEMMFTAALVQLTSTRQLRAYFVTGHGEHDPIGKDEQSGFIKFTQTLVQSGIQPELLTLLGTAEVPADCSLLVIAGPTERLLTEELDKVERYLQQGGRLLVLLGNRNPGRPLGIETLLARWGVVVGDNQVRDVARSISAAARGVDMAQPISSEHPLMKPLLGKQLHLFIPRTVSAIKGKSAAETLKVAELLHTSEDADVIMPDASRRQGSVSVMAAVERGAVRGVSADRGATRIVVTGDSVFLANQLIESAANRDFATHAVNWLVNRNELLAGLGPRPVKEYRLNMTRDQMRAAQWALLVFMPGGVLAFGILVWLRRRS